MNIKNVMQDVMQALGYYGPSNFPKTVQTGIKGLGVENITKVANDPKVASMVMNAANVIGYLPVVGRIIGVARMIFFGAILAKNFRNSEVRTFAGVQIVRGLTEALGYGVAFAIADLLATADRFGTKKSDAEQASTAEKPLVEEID